MFSTAGMSISTAGMSISTAGMSTAGMSIMPEHRV
jgi:hypothetical protein